jgi:anthranilate synthase component 2
LQTVIDLAPTAIVLSPGPETPKKAGVMMELIEHFHDEIPMLGICLGHQGLGEFFGATLLKAEKPMHGKISTVYLQQENNHNLTKSIFSGIPKNFQVVRYHSLLIDNKSKVLDITAITDKGEIMAFQHKTLPIYGIQYHPEAILTEFGMEVLQNWKNIIYNW